MENYSNKSEAEKEEFKKVGENATELLNQALKNLKKAKRWSKLDLIGGKWISTATKQKYMFRARGFVGEAIFLMDKYGREYKSVSYGLGIEGLDTSGPLGTADYSRNDGYIDYVTYERITGMIEIVKNIISKIDELLKENR